MVALNEMPFWGISNQELLASNYNGAIPQDVDSEDDECEALTVEERNRRELIKGLENVKTISKEALFTLAAGGIGAAVWAYANENSLSAKHIAGFCAVELAMLVILVRLVAHKHFSGNPNKRD